MLQINISLLTIGVNISNAVSLNPTFHSVFQRTTGYFPTVRRFTTFQLNESRFYIGKIGQSKIYLVVEIEA